MEEKIDRRKLNGGYRPGAGRPKGQPNIINFKKALREYVSPEELRRMVERAKKFAKTDKKVLMFLLEQIFGKAKTITENVGEKKATNIAIFLDTLEKEKPKLYDGHTIIRQKLEIAEPVHDQGQGSE